MDRALKAEGETAALPGAILSITPQAETDGQLQ